jgi:hypothetical protein
MLSARRAAKVDPRLKVGRRAGLSSSGTTGGRCWLGIAPSCGQISFARAWELMRFLSGAKIRQPSLFAGGELDPLFTMNRQSVDALEQTMPGLKE